jgi:hypothetical protein
MQNFSLPILATNTLFILALVRYFPKYKIIQDKHVTFLPNHSRRKTCQSSCVKNKAIFANFVAIVI